MLYYTVKIVIEKLDESASTIPEEVSDVVLSTYDTVEEAESLMKNIAESEYVDCLIADSTK